MAGADRGAEQHALVRSITASAILGIVGVVVGLVTGSPIILLNGAYAFIGVAVSWLLLAVSRIVGVGPTASYPYGREALTPLVVGIQGFVLLATVAYAAFSAVTAIADGGVEVSVGAALAYAVASTGISVVLWRYLQGAVRGSDLVDAEAAAWRVGALLSVAMTVGFVAMALAAGSRVGAVTPYIDPAMTLAVCAVLVPAPLRMVRGTFVELIEGVPPPAVRDPVLAAVDDVRRRFDLPQPLVRLTKLGPKLYVQVDGAAEATTSIAREDEVRRALTERLGELPFDVWLNFDLFPGELPPSLQAQLDAGGAS